MTLQSSNWGGVAVDQPTLWQDPGCVHRWELQDSQDHEHLVISHPAQSEEASQDSCGNHTCIMCVCVYSHTYVLLHTQL